MPIINKGTSFSNGEQLTADKINDLVDLATFNQNATDSNTTTISTAGQLVVNSGGISSAQLATDAVETAKIKDANVTTAKILDANVTFAKLTDVIDDDTMATATDTTLATSESIKAYTDNRASDPARVYNDLTHSTTSGNVQQNLTGRPLWVSYTIYVSGGDLAFLLGTISPNSNMTGGTRIGQTRIYSDGDGDSGGQVTMIVPSNYYWRFEYNSTNASERVHASFIL
tara:strand:+ start:64 stop:747 length:684 start_codon:yes stop_codon:yes gene_type:complete